MNAAALSAMIPHFGEQSNKFLRVVRQIVERPDFNSRSQLEVLAEVGESYDYYVEDVWPILMVFFLNLTPSHTYYSDDGYDDRMRFCGITDDDCVMFHETSETNFWRICCPTKIKLYPNWPEEIFHEEWRKLLV
jgi:hypothetical protein